MFFHQTARVKNHLLPESSRDCASKLPLGWWVDTQRKAYKAGELSPERVQRLEAVAFAWRLLRGGILQHKTSHAQAEGRPGATEVEPTTDELLA
ncbi:hypothetical protein M885DRAFT_579572 [Pelagophyceae sp. CCMP2097]|nr:hypothetical protein M885DRAFT_579572 [Pelagophyceae sp. CCMP2097]